MELVYICEARKEFGKHPYFTAVAAETLETVPVNEAAKESYIMRIRAYRASTLPHM